MATWKGNMARPLGVRLREKVDRSGGPDACWLWMAQTDRYGYGRIKDGRTPRNAHRVAWELHAGEKIPPGMFVLHSCDNPPCCNPAHLRVGTAKNNTDDMFLRHRNSTRNKPRGSDHGQSVLTELDVLVIRETYRRGDQSIASMSRTYGVSKQCVRHVVRRTTWKHL